MRTTDRQKVRIAPALLVLAITLLQPVPAALADVSLQDKEVLEAVEKVAPTVEEIAIREARQDSGITVPLYAVSNNS